MQRQIILDTETTGLSPKDGHRVIEIGCLELIDRRITGSTFHYYINPDRPIEAGAKNVHGISDDFLLGKPRFAEIATELLAYIRDAELIIHNAPFDIGFLNHEFGLLKQSFGPVTDYCHIIDTLVMARQKHPGQKNSLDALCRRYQVDNSNRELHGALLDSELLAQVYLLMTGGQGSLFDELQPVEQQQVHAIRRVDADRAALPLVSASDAELSEHQAFLAKLRKGGRCVWDEQES